MQFNEFNSDVEHQENSLTPETSIQLSKIAAYSLRPILRLLADSPDQTKKHCYKLIQTICFDCPDELLHDMVLKHKLFYHLNAAQEYNHCSFQRDKYLDIIEVVLSRVQGQPTYERILTRFVQSGGVEVLSSLMETSNADFRHRLRAEAFWRRYIEEQQDDDDIEVE